MTARTAGWALLTAAVLGALGVWALGLRNGFDPWLTAVAVLAVVVATLLVVGDARRARRGPEDLEPPQRPAGSHRPAGSQRRSASTGH